MSPIDTNPNVRTTRTDTRADTRTGGNTAARRSGQGAAVGGGPDSPGAAAGSAGSESVSLTQAAEELLALETQLRALPNVDQARVDSIRQAIEDGSYNVDPQRIVDTLLQSELDLG